MNWLLTLIKLIWSRVSSQFRDKIVDFVLDLEEKAKETENPFDDFAVQVLKLIFGITT